jgi:hypothetical protein
MIVFIGMEASGQLRRRFETRGHYVISCDMLPAEDGSTFTAELGGHIVGDVFEVLEWLWGQGLWPDLGIFHPTCTYLTNSAEWAYADPDFERYPGVGYHQRVKPETLTGGGEARGTRGGAGRRSPDHRAPNPAQVHRESEGRHRKPDHARLADHPAKPIRRRRQQGHRALAFQSAKAASDRAGSTARRR